MKQSNLLQSFRSQKQTREFIERTLDELKEEKVTAENAVETLKSELELEKVKFEAQKSEYETSISLLKDGKVFQPIFTDLFKILRSSKKVSKRKDQLWRKPTKR